MKVQVLYFDGCPHWQVADARLHEALTVLGRNVDVEHVQVTSAQQAQTLGFRGSPSILIDGVDHFAEPGAPVGLTCRLYRTRTGVRGAPTVEQLVEVLDRR